MLRTRFNVLARTRLAETAFQMPDRPPPKHRRNEVRDLQQPIELALNKLPGVWASINRNGAGFYRNGDPCTFGLGPGSPDILMHVELEHDPRCALIQRAGWLEVKWPGESLRPEQRRWHETHRKRVPGAFIAVAHSVEEALAAVERCRRGADR